MTLKELEAAAKADGVRRRGGKSRTGIAKRGVLTVSYYPNCKRFAYFWKGARVNRCDADWWINLPPLLGEQP